MAQKVRVIIGASYGDEGKGLATDYFGAQADKTGGTVNVLTNGGAQRGHTVELSGGTRHVFKHFGSASFRGAVSYMAHQFIINPMELVREYEELAGMGVMPKILIHPGCRFSTPWDMLVNQKLKERDGINCTCGFGIWETVVRYGRGCGTAYAEVSAMGREERILYLRRLRDGYFAARIKELGIRMDDDDVFFSKDLLQHFEEDIAAVSILGETADYKALKRYGTVLFENAQGLLLDGYRKGEENFTTPSVTGAGTVVQTIEDTFRGADVEVCYVTRSYLTRHGAGPMESEFAGDALLTAMPDLAADATNVENDFQGALRYGMLNEDSLAERIRRDTQCFAGRENNRYRPSVLVTHMNEYGGIDTGKILDAFGRVYLSGGKTAEDVYRVV